VFGNFWMNDEAKYIDIHAKKDLKKLQLLRAELDKFEQAIEECMAQAEGENASS
jgi:hypothetical protein